MRNVYRFPLRQHRGAAGILVVTALVGSVYLAAHWTDGDTRQASSASTPVVSPAEAPFVYFPSQYELHAPPGPEEHIQAF